MKTYPTVSTATALAILILVAIAILTSVNLTIETVEIKEYWQDSNFGRYDDKLQNIYATEYGFELVYSHHTERYNTDTIAIELLFDDTYIQSCDAIDTHNDNGHNCVVVVYDGLEPTN